MRGWTGLFSSAFTHSRNAMALIDERRYHVDVNGAHLRLLGYSRDRLVGSPVWEFVREGPAVEDAEWAAALAEGRFTGETELVTADGTVVAVQWGATVEHVTDRHLVLFVALSTRAGERGSGVSRLPKRRTWSCRGASARSSASLRLARRDRRSPTSC